MPRSSSTLSLGRRFFNSAIESFSGFFSPSPLRRRIQEASSESYSDSLSSDSEQQPVRKRARLSFGANLRNQEERKKKTTAKHRSRKQPEVSVYLKKGKNRMAAEFAKPSGRIPAAFDVSRGSASGRITLDILGDDIPGNSRRRSLLSPASSLSLDVSDLSDSSDENVGSGRPPAAFPVRDELADAAQDEIERRRADRHRARDSMIGSFNWSAARPSRIDSRIFAPLSRFSAASSAVRPAVAPPPSVSEVGGRTALSLPLRHEVVDLTRRRVRPKSVSGGLLLDLSSRRFVSSMKLMDRLENEHKARLAKLREQLETDKQTLLATFPAAEKKSARLLQAGVVRCKCVALSPEELTELEARFTNGPPGEILLSGDGPPAFELRRSDLTRLAPGEWLNDEIVNRYISLVVEHHRELSGGQKRIHAFNTFFLGTLETGYDRVKRWTRRLDIFALDKLLIPVHLGNHWCMLVVDFKEKQIAYFDSMGGKNPSATRAVMQYLADDYRDKKKAEFDMSEWTIRSPGAKGVPQQQNCHDCGVFACRVAALIAHDLPLEFSQEDMPAFRKRFLLDLFRGKLSG